MNASDNRFYREPGIASGADRDLAEEIHREIISPEHVRHALDLWNYATRQYLWSDLDCLRYVLDGTSAMAIDAVLARRQRETARTGPWDEP